MKSSLSFASLCVHGAGSVAGPHPAVVPPIYQSATFQLTEETLEAIENGKPRDHLLYSRYGNPTIWHAEEQLARLEGAASAVLFSSGMAAIGAVLLTLTAPGDHVIALLGGYGTTTVFLKNFLEPAGRTFTLIENGEVESYAAAIRSNTKLLFAESLSNPLNFVAEIPRLAELAKQHNALLAVDATFASPALQRPLDLGADVVVHSVSKYLNGHSDVIAGSAAGSKSLMDRVWNHLRVSGGCPDPHAAYLVQRGMRTLHLRMERINQNALELAKFLEQHSKVLQVHYPGLESHPHFQRAGELLPHGCGGIVSFQIQGGDKAALNFCRKVELIQEATSLGGVESLASLPFNTSHSSLTAAEREKSGILPGTIRLAIGIEDLQDLTSDLNQALE